MKFPYRIKKKVMWNTFINIVGKRHVEIMWGR